MVFDCFTYLNEAELLDIRLHELDSIVDKFVLVEGIVTFTNKKKPLYFNRNKNRFKDFKEKIIHIVVGNSPNVSDPWAIERFQFNAIKRGLINAKIDDTILLSCVDEIPKKEKIYENIKKKGINKVFLQKLSYYYLNLATGNNWEGTRMLQYKDLPEDIYTLRHSKADLKIKNGGWHFSYLGGPKRIQEKIRSYSHREYNTIEHSSLKNIENTIHNKKDLFKRELKFKCESYEHLPTYVINNLSKFESLLLPDCRENRIVSFLKKLYE